jgi:hypothetical protein
LLCSVGVEGVERIITARTCRVTQNCLLFAMTHVFATFILSMWKSEEWRVKSDATVNDRTVIYGGSRGGFTHSNVISSCGRALRDDQTLIHETIICQLNVEKNRDILIS